MAFPWPTPRRARRTAPPSRTPSRAPVLARRAAAARAVPQLDGPVEADLCIVGGGFTGLWAALHAKADDPGRDVVVLEAETDRLRRQRPQRRLRCSARSRTGSRTASRASPTRCRSSSGSGSRTSTGSSPTSSGSASTATSSRPASSRRARAAPGRVARRGGGAAARATATTSRCSTREAMRAEVASPTYLGGVWDRTGAALVDPGKLAAGLADAAARAGVARPRALAP